MKITSATITPYSLPFLKPFEIAKTIYKERRGLYLRLETSDGIFGIGEAAPLPGFSVENTDDVQKELEKICKSLVNFEFLGIGEIQQYILGLQYSSPALSAVEHALLSAFLKESGNDASILFPSGANTVIPVNTAIGILDIKETRKRVEDAIKSHYSVIKLKVGRADVADDIKIVKEVLIISDSVVTIRLDANGCWDKDKALFFLDSIGNKIEYIEQPVSALDDLYWLQDRTEILIAADESIIHHETAKSVVEDGKLKVLIIKPLLLGGFFRSIDLIVSAQQRGMQCVVTTALESAIGRKMCVQVASAQGNAYASGLATGWLFSQEVYQDSYPVVDGKIINTFQI